MGDFIQAMVALRHWLERHNLGDTAVTMVLRFENPSMSYEAEAAFLYDAAKEATIPSEGPLNDKVAGINIRFEHSP